MSEYEHFLAEKLLFFRAIDLQEERRNLDLLKSHFSGNVNLTRCHVLIKDLQDSKRLSQQLPPESGQPEFNLLLVSKSFWPIDYDVQTFSTDRLAVGAQFSALRGIFEKAQPIKTAIFHNNLGRVELDLEIRDKKVAVVCQPIHAAIISFFSLDAGYCAEKGVSLAYLVSQLACSQEYLRAKINFWTSKGILTEQDVVPACATEAPEFMVEETFYFMCESLDDQEALLVANLEDDNQQFIKSGQVKGHASDLQRETIQKVILQILNSSGPRSLDQLVGLIWAVYKVALIRTKSLHPHLHPNLPEIVSAI